MRSLAQLCIHVHLAFFFCLRFIFIFFPFLSVDCTYCPGRFHIKISVETSAETGLEPTQWA